MNAETLLSNMTGYVGICLGFCLLQIPPFFEDLYEKITNSAKNGKNNHSNIMEQTKVEPM